MDVFAFRHVTGNLISLAASVVVGGAVGEDGVDFGDPAFAAKHQLAQMILLLAFFDLFRDFFPLPIGRPISKLN